ncbi:transporter [Halovivax limisalsi]|uniref:transporter n=1 Tax=Halovivax limisalsi TaxID=1453760 RepID=UPI001FFDBE62|nr:transporter [Halovivax limisalsi]
MIQHPLAAVLDRTDPVGVVCLVALAATHGLVRLTERYLPAYVVELGYGPIVVGGLATVGFGASAVVAERGTASGRDVPSGAESSGADASASEAAHPAASIGPAAPLRTSLLAAAGLCVVAGATTLDALLGTPLSALGWLAVAVAALQPWHASGPTRSLWPFETLVPSIPSGRDRRSTSSESRSIRGTGVVVGGVSVAVAAIVATAAVASAEELVAGITLLATAGAAVALVAAVALGTSEGERDGREAGRRPNADEDVRDGASNRSIASSSVGSQRRGDSSIERVRTAWSGRSGADRPAIVGDALVRFAVAGIAPFLVLLVVDRGIGLSVGPLSLEPAGAFALFVLAEAAGAILGALASESLAARLGRRAALAGGLVILSLVPTAFVAIAARPALVAAAFGLFGFRTAIEPLRPAVGIDGRAVPVLESPPPPDLRSALRLALVPAPLVAGVLYAIDPLLAFTAATTTGVLGVRELSRAFDFGAGR